MGETGLATMIRQTRLTFGRGYDDAELKTLSAEIVADVSRNLCYVARNLSKSDGASVSMSAEAANFDACNPGRLRDWLQALDLEAVADYYRGNEYSTPSEYYFLDHLERLSDEDYIACSADLLYHRLSYMRLSEESFQINDDTYRIISMADGRAQRRKYIHLFEDVNMILVPISLSIRFGLAVEHFRDSDLGQTASQMHLNHICESRICRNKAVAVVFIDIQELRDEIRAGKNVTDYFPQYDGPRDDLDCIQRFFEHELRRFTTRKQPWELQFYQADLTDAVSFRELMVGISHQLKLLFPVPRYCTGPEHDCMTTEDPYVKPGNTDLDEQKAKFL